MDRGLPCRVCRWDTHPVVRAVPVAQAARVWAVALVDLRGVVPVDRADPVVPEARVDHSPA